jgi:uncharacterized membrane protein
MRYDDDERVASLEQQVAELTRRLEQLEQRFQAAPARASVYAPAPKPAEPASRPEPRPPARSTVPSVPRMDLEDLLGGRILGWLGGSAVVLAAVFFLVMAVSRGWIDEPTRVLLAFLGSTLLLGFGLYLYERQGQTQAALAMVSSAIAALYASLTAATALYDLIDPALGLGVAGLVGASATAIAVRWRSPIVAGLGVVGALLSPVLVDTGTTGTALAFMAIALVASTGILLWQRWDWLASVSFVVSAPQVAVWLFDTHEHHPVRALVVLALFWALYVVAAIGYELRVPIAELRASSAMLLLADAVLVSAGGYLVLADRGNDAAATAWVIALAVLHIGLGAFGFRGRMSSEIGATLIAVGLGLSAIGLGLALNGPALVVGWTVEAVVLAWVAKRTGERRAEVGVGLFLGLAAGHVLLFEAPPDALLVGVDSLAKALIGISMVGGAALAVSRLLDPEPRERRVVLEIVGLTALVYLPSIVIVDTWTTGDAGDPGQTAQLLLSAFWSVSGVAAFVYGLVRAQRTTRMAGLSLLGLAVVKVFLFDLAQLESIYRVLSFLALGLLLLAGAFAYQRLQVTEEESDT